MEPERRYAEFRASADGRTLTGRALVYGDISPDFRERFEPRAFGQIGPVALNLQHDRNIVLVSAEGLELMDSDRALEVRAALPEGSAAAQLVKRGALTGFSVEFLAREEHREGSIRVISRAELTGLALVDRPAYSASKAELRASTAHGAGPLPRVWL